MGNISGFGQYNFAPTNKPEKKQSQNLNPNQFKDMLGEGEGEGAGAAGAAGAAAEGAGAAAAEGGLAEIALLAL